MRSEPVPCESLISSSSPPFYSTKLNSLEQLELSIQILIPTGVPTRRIYLRGRLIPNPPRNNRLGSPGTALNHLSPFIKKIDNCEQIILRSSVDVRGKAFSWERFAGASPHKNHKTRKNLFSMS